MAALIPQKMFDEQLAAMDIENFAQATIRQVGAVGGALEKNSGTEFLHLEMGVPGLPPETVGVEAEQQALAQGHASIYPSITGIAPLKSEASRFVKAFLDIDVAPEGCIPTVGSMQGGFCLFQISSQCDPKKDTILFIDPGFPVQRQQVRILGIKHESFDIYDFRAEKLGPKLESYLKQGNVAAIIYSNPNNPAWICSQRANCAPSASWQTSTTRSFSKTWPTWAWTSARSWDILSRLRSRPPQPAIRITTC